MVRVNFNEIIFLKSKFSLLAVAYGQGCYFARHSVYSHNYSLADRNGIRRMFLGTSHFLYIQT